MGLGVHSPSTIPGIFAKMNPCFIEYEPNDGYYDEKLKNRKIKFVHYDPNYKVRATVKEILENL